MARRKTGSIVVALVVVMLLQLHIATGTGDVCAYPVVDYSIAVVRDDTNVKMKSVGEHLVSGLSVRGFVAEFLDYEHLCDDGSLDEYDCLVYMRGNRPVEPEGCGNLLKFLVKGRDLILLGGGIPSFDLPVFEDRDIYHFRDAVSIGVYKEQDIFQKVLKVKGKFSGISAIGFEYPEVSEYIPILEVCDGYGRRVGFACGLLVHYAGQFKNGHWLIFGIDGPDFYNSGEFIDITLDILGKIREGNIPDELAERERVNKKTYQDITSAGPSDFVKLSEDGKHFILPDGRKFFAIGCNYLGSFERMCEYGESYYNYKRLEEDFKKAKEAGVNSMRLWNFRIDKYPKRFKSLLELARRYQIYLILHPRAHPLASDKKLMKVFARNAAAVDDQTIVLGYDLMNEPQVTMVGSVSINGEKSAILEHKVYERYSDAYFDKRWVEDIAAKRGGWPELGSWIKGEGALNLYAAYSMGKRYIEKYNPPQDYSSLYGIETQLPIGEDANYIEFITALDDTFRDWILFHKKAIESFDKHHFITVGYNTYLVALPANGLLDFVSHHIYQMPYSYEDIQKAVTTFDRLRSIWPDKPITLGEFGFSSGLKLSSGECLSADAASVAEMIVYLYAFANDYSGAYLWMLSEWPVANMKYNAPWISPDRYLYESRFGMYYYDGTDKGAAKPIAYATKFFRRYVDSHQPGNGQIEIVKADTPFGAGYVFTDEDALFVGNNVYKSEGLEFNSDRPVNVMLLWGTGWLDIMATADVEVSVGLSKFGFSDGVDFKMEGLYDSVVKEGSKVKLKLLRGEVVRFSVME